MANRLAALEAALAVCGSAELEPSRHRTRWMALQSAWNGLRGAWVSEPNLRLHAGAGGFVIGVGLLTGLGATEWLWLCFAIGLVIFAELMNTAIERTVDLVVGLSPDPLARQVKDVAAGFVLIAACLAVVIGLLTFGPHVFAR